MYYQNILDTIGGTPLVKLNKVTAELPCTVLAKIESFNPGNSIKDRIALTMVEDAEEEGLLKQGSTIIEGTSGNTGMGLAIAAIVKGYKCIFTTNDKQSKEKVDILRALGAEVIVCPTAVAPDDPRSYYSVAERLNKEIPNSWYPNQYNNLSNTKAHYEQTGPEIWEQTEGEITHLVVGVGTGGTISGCAKFLKEKNPDVKIWGIDSYGSVFKKYLETGEFDEKEIYPYLTEGIGEDILPENVDFDLIDHFEKVTDKDGALMTRAITRKEGIFVGYSAGSAVAGLIQMKDQLKKDDTVVIIMHDHGSRYVAKLFNDDWMRERGFLDIQRNTALSLVENHKYDDLVTIGIDDNILKAIETMSKFDISQIPVKENGEFVGSIDDSHIFAALLKNPDLKNQPIKEIMQDPFPFVDPNTSIEEVSSNINRGNSAVLVKDAGDKVHIITKQDIIQAIQ
ncbi:MAG TPA: pyridoxal-phosphate dependent enzyme [Flavobacteriales bacterium]|nr:pyridoxal-phosphate dependent enzyme [Flavobacteriales bacterium]HIA10653.1 pyridoxal-phosphate dependent enzyme [Flavobacteriales bacterium]